MNRTRLLGLTLLPCLLLVSCGEKSQKPAVASTHRPTSEAEFLDALVAATRSGNPEAVQALVHPATLQGIDETNAFVFTELFAREVKRSIPDERRVTIRATTPDAPLPFEGSFVYPVRPTLSMTIEFDDSSVRKVTMRREVFVDDQGVWWLVFPIPTRQMTDQLKMARASGEDAERLVERQVAEMEAPLRERLDALLRDGRKIDAIKRYREASGQGLRVAKAVVEALQAELTDDDRTPAAAAR